MDYITRQSIRRRWAEGSHPLMERLGGHAQMLCDLCHAAIGGMHQPHGFGFELRGVSFAMDTAHRRLLRIVRD